MDRYWLLTWTTYGTWLPGDERGFVGRVRVADSLREKANRFQTESHQSSTALKAFSVSQLKHTPIQLNQSCAETLFKQFHETAQYRHYRLIAAAIMSNHIHLIVGVYGDPDPSTLLRDFKSYGSRALNHTSPVVADKRWWTEHGSTRKLSDEVALSHTIVYVRQQKHSLMIWSDDVWISEHLSNRILNPIQSITGGTHVPPLA